VEALKLSRWHKSRHNTKNLDETETMGDVVAEVRACIGFVALPKEDHGIM
jgi:hypothetical protein